MIRIAQPDDAAAIAGLLARAFGGTAEADLVIALRAGGHVLTELVAEQEGTVIATVMFSHMDRDGFVVLGPLAVGAAHRGRGSGSALVRAGLAACVAAGTCAVTVRGDPAFYGRFGFSADLARRIANRFAGPHLQAIELKPGALSAPVAIRHAPPFDALG